MTLLERMRRRGRWAPWALAALIAAIAGGLIGFAYGPWSGATPPTAYENGERHDDAPADEAAQRQLGWQVFVAFTATAARAGEVGVWASGPDGAWLTGAETRVAFLRPAAGSPALDIVLPEGSAGSYGARVELPQSGKWDMRVTITHGGRVFRTLRRIEAP